MYLLIPAILWLIDLATRRSALVNIVWPLAFLFFIFGGKYYNGWDWTSYNLYFDCALPLIGGFQSCAPETLEIGFHWLNRVVKTFSTNVQALYVVIAAAQLGALLYYARRTGTRFANLALLWVLVFGWALLMQVLRQGLAVSSLLIAVVMFREQRTRHAAAWAAVAVSMHYTALIPIGIALIAQGRTRMQRVAGAAALAGLTYLGVRFGGAYLDSKLDLYSGGVGFNPTRIMRYLLFAPMLWYAYRARDVLAAQFGPRLYAAGAALTVFGVALLPFIATQWATRLIIYAQVPLVLACAYLISQRLYSVPTRLAMVLPLVIVYAYPYLEPINAVDVRPLHNYWIDVGLLRDDTTYSEAYSDLIGRLCDVGRCPY